MEQSCDKMSLVIYNNKKGGGKNFLINNLQLWRKADDFRNLMRGSHFMYNKYLSRKKL